MPSRGGFDARQEWTLLLAAVQVLTRIPVTVAHGPDTLRNATRYMPLVGLGIGGAAAAVFAAARTGLPPAPAALLALAATLLLTGALHEDGLADCCDGLGGGRTRADALRIMRDSRIGAFGALGLLATVGTKLACLAALAQPEHALVAAAAASGSGPCCPQHCSPTPARTGWPQASLHPAHAAPPPPPPAACCRSSSSAPARCRPSCCRAPSPWPSAPMPGTASAATPATCWAPPSN